MVEANVVAELAARLAESKPGPASNGFNIIKVSSQSRSTAVAGAVAGVIREHRRAEVQAIGASAVNQAVKAIAIARTYLEEDGLDLWCQPTFTEVEINGQERTAVRFHVISVPRAHDEKDMAA